MKQAYGEVSYATAAEVSRNFGRWQDQALAGPVVVTHHGRPRVVVLSAQQYDALTAEAGEDRAEDSPETKRLQEIEAALRAFQQATAGGVVRLSRRGIVVEMDDGVAQSLGVTGDEALGSPFADFIAGDERRRLSAALEACFEDGVPAQLQIGVAGGPNSTKAVGLSLAPVMRDGLIDGVMIAVTLASR